MPTFAQALTPKPRGTLQENEIERLHQLLADWQVVSDISESDLLLWLPDGKGGFQCAAHCRPATAPTVHVDDVVGLSAPKARATLMRQVMSSQRIEMNPMRRWTGMNTVNELLVPVCYGGKCLGIMAKESNAAYASGFPGGETWYRDVADDLCRMINHGDFPYPATPTGGKRGMPRATDGALLLDEEGIVRKASPNAVSAFRRLGITGPLVNSLLAKDVTSLMEELSVVDETLAVVIMGRASWFTELEARGVVLTIRALPLYAKGQRKGAVLLCRDVTELRRREMELMSKDATIREIHHRVKNNLQTVSALLRLQSRRSGSEEVKQALGEAERRVAAIATVHEALSHTVDETVDFDDVFSRVLALAASAASEGQQVVTEIDGSFGSLGADAASALGVVLTELVTNAVEHGYGKSESGKIILKARRGEGILDVEVIDDGVGIESASSISGLGTQIVSTLVKGELGGTIEWNPRPSPDHGTIVKLHATKLD